MPLNDKFNIILAVFIKNWIYILSPSDLFAQIPFSLKTFDVEYGQWVNYFPHSNAGPSATAHRYTRTHLQWYPHTCTHAHEYKYELETPIGKCQSVAASFV